MNVLIVVLDDVGVDQVGRWGMGEVTAPTPTLDCLCDRGVRFERAWANALCSPGRAQLFTGRSSVRNGIGHNVEPGQELAASEVTFGELAQQAGYTTGLVGKWHLGGFTSPSGMDGPNLQGFDTFAGSLGNLTNDWQGGNRVSLHYTHWIKVVDGESEMVDDYATSVTADDALDFVHHAEEPWLLVASFNAPHKPRHVPPARLITADDPGTSPNAQYRAMLEAADHELGRLLRGIGRKTLGRTMVVLTSDNGTPEYVVVPPIDPGQHKETMFEGGLRVPLVVSGPGIDGPATSDALVSLTDLLPTIAEWIGAPLPPAPLDGRSLVPALERPGVGGHDVLTDAMFGDGSGLRIAARSDRYKLIREGGAETMYAVPGSAFEDLAAPLAQLTEDEAAERRALAAALDELAVEYAELAPDGAD